MKLDCRDEKHGVWRSLPAGSHQAVSSAILNMEDVLQSLFLHPRDLRAAIRLIVECTANCLGQIALQQSCELGSMKLYPLCPSASIIENVKGARDRVVAAIVDDSEFLNYWNDIDAYGREYPCDLRISDKSDLIQADIVGLVRLATRMAGVGIGQCLSEAVLAEELVGREQVLRLKWCNNMESA